MTNVISQYLGLDVVNISVYAKVNQNIPNDLRVIDIFANCPGTNLHKQVGDTPVTKSNV